jgi:hypothetical protein
VTVSAYQNTNLTQLKIDHNPFAKGFRDRMKAQMRQQAQQTNYNMAPIQFYAGDGGYRPAAPVLSHPVQPLLGHHVQPMLSQPIQQMSVQPMPVLGHPVQPFLCQQVQPLIGQSKSHSQNCSRLLLFYTLSSISIQPSLSHRWFMVGALRPTPCQTYPGLVPLL